MTSTTSAGSALALSVASPATQDLAGYSALTYTEVGGIEKLGAIGATFPEIEFTPLKGETDVHKGTPNYGSIPASAAYDAADAGQTLLRTAADDATSKLYSMMITYPTGEKRYSQIRVFGAPETVDGANTVIMTNATIRLCRKVVKGPAA